MSNIKVEFLVQMTCDSCVEAVKKSLADVRGVTDVNINLDKGSVVVESSLPILDLQKRLESTGRKVAVKGYSGSIAAVSIIEAGIPNIRGVVRFIQATPDSCIIDGTIDGLRSGEHRLSVHECGDISKGCESVGSIYNPTPNSDRDLGDLGAVTAGDDGRAAFRFEDKYLKLSDVIGRSFVISNSKDNQTSACGIIARSAGLFQNPKTICACDGVSIWDEVSKPKSSSNL